MVFCLGTEGSNGSLIRNGWFQRFSVLGAQGSNGSLFRNGWFQCFVVKELKVPKVPYLEMGGSNVVLFRS